VQEETFRLELARRGLIKDKKYKNLQTSKKCAFCECINGIGDEVCATCKRPLNRERILKEQEAKKTELQELRKHMATMQQNYDAIATRLKSIEQLEKLVAMKLKAR
jgi:hypothetical protein